ncbi:hypothetical protein LUZ63_020369 [Rhynchospora breviuscula]|uniref:Uncharacterized protein n=1 Tax=Rhynchospora breviuscula TaxID=2022672 RepID=A0A9P9Z942_9POAL|nr:hypothetical protein LUZ63_020369 [Rhynchospora breviuscula]
MWLVSLGILVFQNDLGSSLLFFGLFLVMLYVATERPGWLVVGTVLFAAGAYAGYLYVGQVQVRVSGWLDPFGNADRAYQLIRGSTAWPGAGCSAAAWARARRNITPLSWSDFILPAFGEELGLTGVMAIIVLYGLIVERALRISLICRDGFGKLVAVGLGVVFALQVFVVIGGVTRLIPLTGLTTPFLSAGGSSLVANWGDHRAAAAHLRPGPTTPARERHERRRRRPDPGGEPAMNKPIRALSVFCLVLFALLLGNATFLQYWQSGELTSLSDHPTTAASATSSFSQERGAILVDGKAVAQSVPSKDGYDYQRVYPQGRRYAALTGYYTRDYGLGGVEATENDILSGSDPGLFVNRVIDLIGNDDTKGGNVTLTVNRRRRRRRTTACASSATTTKGAVRGHPAQHRQDPGDGHEPDLRPERAGHARLRPRRQGQVPPGVRRRRPAAEPRHRGRPAARVDLQARHRLRGAQRPLHARLAGPRRPHAGPAADRPRPAQRERRLLRGQPDLADPRARRVLQRRLRLARAAAGRHEDARAGREVRLRPALLHPARRRAHPPGDQPVPRAGGPGAAVRGLLRHRAVRRARHPAADGDGLGGHRQQRRVMKPYLVDELQTPDLDTLRRTDPEALSDDALSPADARELTQMMVSVVDDGTGTAARIDGVEVAGKTGTAQSAPNRPPYAWFTSFAPATNAQVAVAVLVQDAGVDRNAISGNGLAAPIARSVMQAVLKK